MLIPAAFLAPFLKPSRQILVAALFAPIDGNLDRNTAFLIVVVHQVGIAGVRQPAGQRLPPQVEMRHVLDARHQLSCGFSYRLEAFIVGIVRPPLHVGLHPEHEGDKRIEGGGKAIRDRLGDPGLELLLTEAPARFIPHNPLVALLKKEIAVPIALKGKAQVLGAV